MKRYTMGRAGAGNSAQNSPCNRSQDTLAAIDSATCGSRRMGMEEAVEVENGRRTPTSHARSLAYIALQEASMMGWGRAKEI